jgi:hypothetical protein
VSATASKDDYAYSCHLTVRTINEFFDGEFKTLEVLCLPRSSALRITLDHGIIV